MNATQDDRGRSWWDIFPMDIVKQVNVSAMHPDAIKGLHLHRKQTDYWFCAAGVLLVITGLDDEAEPTRTVLYPGDWTSIKPEVWHGCRAIGGTPALLVYGVTEIYDPRRPDEFRLPWDHFGKEVWEMQPR